MSSQLSYKEPFVSPLIKSNHFFPFTDKLFVHTLEYNAAPPE